MTAASPWTSGSRSTAVGLISENGVKPQQKAGSSHCLSSDSPVLSIPQFCVKSMFNRQTCSETKESRKLPRDVPLVVFPIPGVCLPLKSYPCQGGIFSCLPPGLSHGSPWHSDGIFKAICSVFTGKGATLCPSVHSSTIRLLTVVSLDWVLPLQHVVC